MVKEPPRSTYHPKARTLIDTVLAKEYQRAMRLVEVDEVPVNAHDIGENTLLTTLAKESGATAKDLEFAIDSLGASLDTSCDCPAHRTALHYASKRGDWQKVEVLLNKGANPNLITSNGETALDMAKIHNHTKVAELIESRGGVAHATAGKVGLWNSIAGYRPEQRTILSDENKKLK